MSFSSSKIGTKVFAAIVAFASLSAVSLAQGTPSVVRVKVPFAFETSSARQLPAGVYTVQIEQQHVLLIHGTSASAFTLVQPNGNKDMVTTERGKLVFHHQGNRYFLREVWMPGQNTHDVTPASRQEKIVERASSAVLATDVEVALLEEPR